MAKKILQVNIRVFLVLKLLTEFFGIISNLWIEPSGFVELYYSPSQLRCYSPSRGEHDVCIGNGLFSSRDIEIPPNTHIIVYLVREAISDSIIINTRRNRSERGGYLLTNATVTQALDCFDTCKLGQCLASFANCTKSCFNVVKKRRAAANARLTMRAFTGKYWYPPVLTGTPPPRY